MAGIVDSVAGLVNNNSVGAFTNNPYTSFQQQQQYNANNTYNSTSSLSAINNSVTNSYQNRPNLGNNVINSLNAFTSQNRTQQQGTPVTALVIKQATDEIVGAIQTTNQLLSRLVGLQDGTEEPDYKREANNFGRKMLALSRTAIGRLGLSIIGNAIGTASARVDNLLQQGQITNTDLFISKYVEKIPILKEYFQSTGKIAQLIGSQQTIYSQKTDDTITTIIPGRLEAIGTYAFEISKTSFRIANKIDETYYISNNYYNEQMSHNMYIRQFITKEIIYGNNTSKPGMLTHFANFKEYINLFKNFTRTVTKRYNEENRMYKSKTELYNRAGLFINKALDHYKVVEDLLTRIANKQNAINRSNLGIDSAREDFFNTLSDQFKREANLYGKDTLQNNFKTEKYESYKESDFYKNVMKEIIEERNSKQNFQFYEFADDLMTSISNELGKIADNGNELNDMMGTIRDISNTYQISLNEAANRYINETRNTFKELEEEQTKQSDILSKISLTTDDIYEQEVKNSTLGIIENFIHNIPNLLTRAVSTAIKLSLGFGFGRMILGGMSKLLYGSDQPIKGSFMNVIYQSLSFRGIKDLLGILKDFIWEKLQFFWNGDTGKQLKEKYGAMFDKTLDFIYTQVRDLMFKIMQKVSFFFMVKVFGNLLSDFLSNKYVEFKKNLYNNISNTISGIGNIIKGVFHNLPQNIIQGFKNFFSQEYNPMINYVITEPIKRGFEHVKNFIINWWNTPSSSPLRAKLWRGTVQLFNSTIELTTGIANTVIEGFKAQKNVTWADSFKKGFQGKVNGFAKVVLDKLLSTDNFELYKMFEQDRDNIQKRLNALNSMKEMYNRNIQNGVHMSKQYLTYYARAMKEYENIQTQLQNANNELEAFKRQNLTSIKWQQFVTYIKNKLNNAKTIISGWYEYLIDGAKNIVQDQSRSGFTRGLAAVGGVALEAGKKVTSTFVRALQKGAALAVNLTQGIGQAVVGGLSMLAEGIKPGLGEVVQAAATAVTYLFSKWKNEVAGANYDKMTISEIFFSFVGWIGDKLVDLITYAFTDLLPQAIDLLLEVGKKLIIFLPKLFMMPLTMLFKFFEHPLDNMGSIIKIAWNIGTWVLKKAVIFLKDVFLGLLDVFTFGLAGKLFGFNKKKNNIEHPVAESINNLTNTYNKNVEEEKKNKKKEEKKEKTFKDMLLENLANIGDTLSSTFKSVISIFEVMKPKTIGNIAGGIRNMMKQIIGLFNPEAAQKMEQYDFSRSINYMKFIAEKLMSNYGLKQSDFNNVWLPIKESQAKYNAAIQQLIKDNNNKIIIKDNEGNDHVFNLTFDYGMLEQLLKPYSDNPDKIKQITDAINASNFNQKLTNINTSINNQQIEYYNKNATEFKKHKIPYTDIEVLDLSSQDNIMRRHTDRKDFKDQHRGNMLNLLHKGLKDKKISNFAKLLDENNLLSIGVGGDYEIELNNKEALNNLINLSYGINNKNNIKELEKNQNMVNAIANYKTDMDGLLRIFINKIKSNGINDDDITKIENISEHLSPITYVKKLINEDISNFMHKYNLLDIYALGSSKNIYEKEIGTYLRNNLEYMLNNLIDTEAYIYVKLLNSSGFLTEDSNSINDESKRYMVNLLDNYRGNLLKDNKSPFLNNFKENIIDFANKIVKEKKYNNTGINIDRISKIGNGIGDPVFGDWKKYYPDVAAFKSIDKLPAWSKYIIEAALLTGIDPELISSVIMNESRGNPKAVSHAGAHGLMQIMPRTQKDIHRLYKVTADMDRDGGPRQNIIMGAYYLKALKEVYGKRYGFSNWVDLLRAYNAGFGNVIKWKKRGLNNDMIPNKEAREYPGKVLQWYGTHKFTDPSMPIDRELYNIIKQKGKGNFSSNAMTDFGNNNDDINEINSINNDISSMFTRMILTSLGLDKFMDIINPNGSINDSLATNSNASSSYTYHMSASDEEDMKLAQKYLTFSGSSGTLKSFMMVNPRLRKPFLAMAEEYYYLKDKPNGLGNKLLVTSAWRSKEYQAKLYNMAQSGSGKVKMAAPPSDYAPHYLGTALDINGKQADFLHTSRLLSKYGLAQSYPIGHPKHNSDPYHIEHKDWLNMPGKERFKKFGNYAKKIQGDRPYIEPGMNTVISEFTTTTGTELNNNSQSDNTFNSGIPFIDSMINNISSAMTNMLSQPNGSDNSFPSSGNGMGDAIDKSYLDRYDALAAEYLIKEEKRKVALKPTNYTAKWDELVSAYNDKMSGKRKYIALPEKGNFRVKNTNNLSAWAKMGKINKKGISVTDGIPLNFTGLTAGLSDTTFDNELDKLKLLGLNITNGTQKSQKKSTDELVDKLTEIANLIIKNSNNSSGLLKDLAMMSLANLNNSNTANSALTQVINNTTNASVANSSNSNVSSTNNGNNSNMQSSILNGDCGLAALSLVM